MTRVRTDNVFGTLTDNPLTNVATTMNSAGLANLAAVSSAEAIIVLDPNRVSGAPEIVVVTAHTGSATSATIVRGEFGTTARSHALGTEWVHGPIASNATTFVTAGDDQGDYAPGRPWQSWTPTLTNLTLGNGTSVGTFVRVGLTTIHWRYKFTLGSSSAVAADPSFTLPVPYATAYATDRDTLGAGILSDAGANFVGEVWPANQATGRVRFVAKDSSGSFLVYAQVTATVPFTWATGDTLSASGTYEAAS